MSSDDDDLTSDLGDFDLDRSTEQSWSGFSARLADVLSVMDEGATLRIGAVAGESEPEPPYVSFRAEAAGRLVATAAGNDQMSPSYRLGEEAVQALLAAGWQGPDAEHGGFWYEGTQEASSVLADRAVDVLRNTYGVPHPAFVAPDQLAEILTPQAPLERPAQTDLRFDPEALVARVPASRDDLDAMVEAELSRLLGHAPVRDADGDFAIRVGSTMLFVRSSGDAREVTVFSAVVHDVEGRSRAMEVLSDLNSEIRYARFWLLRDRVFLSVSLFAHPFVPAHLSQALELLAVTADSIDEDLAMKLRGRTTFDDEAPQEGE